ncbi:hypothetical protein C1646_778369, partial [Rhizophagus diaphanus]
KLYKASKKVNWDRTSTTPSTRQTSTTPNTRQTSTTPNTGQTSTPKKVDILIVLRYSVPLFKGVLTIPKKFINIETNQYEKSAAKNKPPDEEIVEVDRRQTSTTPNTRQTSTPKKKMNQYEKSAASKDELSDEVEIVKVALLMESRQKSKTSRDLEESHTDKEMAREFLPYDFSSSPVEPSESLAYRYNNSDYGKLKRGNKL